MVLRIAAKNKLNAYTPVLWFNNVAVGVEIDQARNSPPLSLSPLTACAYMLIELLGGGTVEADAKLEKVFTRRIGTILHGTSCRYLYPIAPCRWSPWKVLQLYIECKVVITTECNDVLPGLWTRFYERDPVGHTGTSLREGLYRSRGKTYPKFPSSRLRLNPFGGGVGARRPEFGGVVLIGVVLRICKAWIFVRHVPTQLLAMGSGIE